MSLVTLCLWPQGIHDMFLSMVHSMEKKNLPSPLYVILVNNTVTGQMSGSPFTVLVIYDHIKQFLNLFFTCACTVEP